MESSHKDGKFEKTKFDGNNSSTSVPKGTLPKKTSKQLLQQAQADEEDDDIDYIPVGVLQISPAGRPSLVNATVQRALENQNLSDQETFHHQQTPTNTSSFQQISSNIPQLDQLDIQEFDQASTNTVLNSQTIVPSTSAISNEYANVSPHTKVNYNWSSSNVNNHPQQLNMDVLAHRKESILQLLQAQQQKQQLQHQQLQQLQRQQEQQEYEQLHQVIKESMKQEGHLPNFIKPDRPPEISRTIRDSPHVPSAQSSFQRDDYPRNTPTIGSKQLLKILSQPHRESELIPKEAYSELNIVAKNNQSRTDMSGLQHVEILSSDAKIMNSSRTIFKSTQYDKQLRLTVGQNSQSSSQQITSEDFGPSHLQGKSEASQLTRVLRIDTSDKVSHNIPKIAEQLLNQSSPLTNTPNASNLHPHPIHNLNQQHPEITKRLKSPVSPSRQGSSPWEPQSPHPPGSPRQAVSPRQASGSPRQPSISPCQFVSPRQNTSPRQFTGSNQRHQTVSPQSFHVPTPRLPLSMSTGISVNLSPTNVSSDSTQFNLNVSGAAFSQFSSPTAIGAASASSSVKSISNYIGHSPNSVIHHGPVSNMTSVMQTSSVQTPTTPICSFTSSHASEPPMNSVASDYNQELVKRQLGQLHSVDESYKDIPVPLGMFSSLPLSKASSTSSKSLSLSTPSSSTSPHFMSMGVSSSSSAVSSSSASTSSVAVAEMSSNTVPSSHEPKEGKVFEVDVKNQNDSCVFSIAKDGNISENPSHDNHCSDKVDIDNKSLVSGLEVKPDDKLEDHGKHVEGGVKQTVDKESAKSVENLKTDTTDKIELRTIIDKQIQQRSTRSHVETNSVKSSSRGKTSSESNASSTEEQSTCVIDSKENNENNVSGENLKKSKENHEDMSHILSPEKEEPVKRLRKPKVPFENDDSIRGYSSRKRSEEKSSSPQKKLKTSSTPVKDSSPQKSRSQPNSPVKSPASVTTRSRLKFDAIKRKKANIEKAKNVSKNDQLRNSERNRLGGGSNNVTKGRPEETPLSVRHSSRLSNRGKDEIKSDNEKKDKDSMTSPSLKESESRMSTRNSAHRHQMTETLKETNTSNGNSTQQKTNDKKADKIPTRNSVNSSRSTSQSTTVSASLKMTTRQSDGSNVKVKKAHPEFMESLPLKTRKRPRSDEKSSDELSLSLEEESSPNYVLTRSTRSTKLVVEKVNEDDDSKTDKTSTGESSSDQTEQEEEKDDEGDEDFEASEDDLDDDDYEGSPVKSKRVLPRRMVQVRRSTRMRQRAKRMSDDEDAGSESMSTTESSIHERVLRKRLSNAETKSCKKLVDDQDMISDEKPDVKREIKTPVSVALNGTLKSESSKFKNNELSNNQSPNHPYMISSGGEVKDWSKVDKSKMMAYKLVLVPAEESDSLPGKSFDYNVWLGFGLGHVDSLLGISELSKPST